MDEHRKTIMMVDSRPVQREKVKEILEGTYEIKEAESEEDAILQLTWAGPVDAILLGSLMHGSRTVGFLDHIRKSGYASVPVIVILEDSGEAVSYTHLVYQDLSSGNGPPLSTYH